MSQKVIGLIGGCTEIMLLVRPEDSRVPLFDATATHAEAAVNLALREGAARRLGTLSGEQ